MSSEISVSHGRTAHQYDSRRVERSFALWPLILVVAIVGVVIATANSAPTAEQRGALYLQSGIVP